MLWIPSLTRMSLIEYYCMLQNARVIAYTFFNLLENKLGGGGGVKLNLLPSHALHELA